MALPSKIKPPKTPNFLMAPDHKNMELYILHTNPFALIWVRQTVPAQMWIVEGEQSEKILREASEFYKNYIIENSDKN